MMKNQPVIKSYTAAMIFMTIIFFMWGFITCLNDILIPHLKSLFHLNYAQAMLVQFCFFLAYLVMSLPMAYVLKKLHYQVSMALGMGIAGFGCLLFIPAAYLSAYIFFLVSFFILASGIVLLQVAANPYVTLLGVERGASSRLTFAQAVNSLAYTVAPFFGALLILSTPVLADKEIAALDPSALQHYKTAIIHTVQTPYLILAITLFIIAAVILFFKLPAVSQQPTNRIDQQFAASKPKLFMLWFGAIAIFLYVGAEVSTGSFIVNYLGLPQIAHLSPQVAAHFVSVYWGGAMVGRFMGSWLLKKLFPPLLIMFNALLAIILLIVSIVASGTLSMWSILSLGLFNSILFPTIFALAIKDLGAWTSYGSGVLCAAIVGGAIIPELQGILADHIGAQSSFLLLIFCYLVILSFGWASSRLKPRSELL